MVNQLPRLTPIRGCTYARRSESSRFESFYPTAIQPLGAPNRPCSQTGTARRRSCADLCSVDEWELARFIARALRSAQVAQRARFVRLRIPGWSLRHHWRLHPACRHEQSRSVGNLAHRGGVSSKLFQWGSQPWVLHDFDQPALESSQVVCLRGGHRVPGYLRLLIWFRQCRQ